MNPDKFAASSVVDMVVLGQLLEEYRPRLLAMVRRRLDPALASRVDAEEIVNDGFFLAQRKWPRFKEQNALSPYAWLYGIVRDCLIETWRRETRGLRDARKNQPWPQESSEQLGLGLVAAGTSPSEAIVRDELRQCMQQALNRLKDGDREILWMRHYDQLAFPEAAQVLGITENAATVRYVRALRRLKDLWRRLYRD
ncbi:MAG TPA: sigma-70 family RNA polymerase sigma factor [Gemmataceae bacterium]|jgi:RNA polymerase sigma-70 factor (ECF subfamily)|nr:sigma-70 family RNA polymerase sigma factor [Gemmataceae bacterium]